MICSGQKFIHAKLWVVPFSSSFSVVILGEVAAQSKDLHSKTGRRYPASPGRNNLPGTIVIAIGWGPATPQPDSLAKQAAALRMRRTVYGRIEQEEPHPWRTAV
jgi:hypothetical protein